MATIGVDAEVIIDAVGYYVMPNSYILHIPRIRKAEVRADAGESYVDLGPGRREWHMSILAVNDLLKYDGTSLGVDGQTIRDALYTSYQKVGVAINFTDPQNGAPVSTHFDSYIEKIVDLHTQITEVATGGSFHPSYYISIILIEAS